MPILFRVRRYGREARWVVLVEDQVYGEYLDRKCAVLDAIEAVTDAREKGAEAEVWDQSVRVY